MPAHAILLDMPDHADDSPLVDREDRILRRWTPVLLRSVLAIAVILMATGIALTFFLPHHQVAGMAALDDASRTAGFSSAHILSAAAAGDPNALATLGLMALTLVPLVRVAFCMLLFLKQRSMMFVAFTAYVLAALTLGILLGKIG